MKLKSFLSFEEIHLLQPLLKGKAAPAMLFLAQSFLRGLSRAFGLEFGVAVPFELASYAPASWEALATIKKLKRLGIAISFTETQKQYEDEPQGHISSIKISESKRSGSNGYGRDLLDRTRTLWPAIGEAVERWSVNYFQPNGRDIIDSSYEALKGNKVDILSMPHITGRKGNRHAKEYTFDFDEKTVFRWVRGISLLNKKEIFIPLQMVTFAHNKDKKEPLLTPAITTGAAAGQTLTYALLGGVLEVIERDAIMIYWLNKISPDIIDMETVPDDRFKRVADIVHRYKLETYLLYLKTDVPVHTVLSLVIDRSGVGSAVILGASSGLDLCETAYKAVSDSLTIRSGLRLKKEDMKSLNVGDLDLLNAKTRALFWSRKEKIKDVEFLMRGVRKHFREFPTYAVERDDKKRLERLLSFFRENNYEVVYKELLETKLKRELDMTVVFVKIPAFQPLHLYEPTSTLDGKRLKEIPTMVGFEAIDPLNTEPHPFL